MRPVLSRAQVREFERRFVDAGMPSLLLMENAGRGAAHWLGLRAKPRDAQPARRAPLRGSCVRCADEAALGGVSMVVLAGPGNNGGDGYVVARHLLQRGARVEVASLVPLEELRGDARLACDAYLAVGGRCTRLDEERAERLVDERTPLVDALFGTGLSRSLPVELSRWIERWNEAELDVVALDLPSGLDADTGAMHGAVLRARHTITFGHLKIGSLTTRGHEYGGTVTVSHIGVPSAWPAEREPAAWLLEDDDLRALLAPRAPVVHKGQAGRVAVLGGQPGMGGAPLLTGRAALRGGAGLCTLVGDEATRRQWEREALELMIVGASPEALDGAREVLARADALVIGPGLGRSTWADTLLELGLAARKPTVLDADGLRLLAAGGSAAFARARAHGALVLTPHPGEAAALLGVEIAAIEDDRLGATSELVTLTGAVVVLKGSRTTMGAPGRTSCLSAWGTPALATAGSGDVLAGVVAAQLADHTRGARSTWDAARLAVGLHGLAGESWQREHGDAGLLASELADLVPRVRAELLAGTA